ncbi:MAG TPA: glycoside hydrolase family 6 protein, partial [Actinocrinis sp.]|uniref:glycoside hydrolase family 6 protein n=1 Tax=Actinocrinis sp. TaxID=1920516 RepID=UPI002DDD6C4E
GCSVSYTIASDWGTGFSTNIVITNLGSPITSWSLTWSFAGNQTVTQLWNGSYTQSGKNVTVTNLSYNGSIGTNGTTSLGFNGAYTGTNAAPASFAINGTTCTGTVTGSASPSASPSQSASASPSPSHSASASASASASPSPSASNTGCGNSCPPHVANPFLGVSYYLNPNYVAEVQAQASADGNKASEAKVGTYQTAIWMDHIGAIAGDSTHTGLQAQFDNAATQAASSSLPVMIEVVIYDLPGRDCAALASNGEIPATAAGLTQYESQYIDPIVAIEGNSKYSKLRIVNFIEPDSLPNAVTNKSLSACSTAIPYYETGIEYALSHLHAIGPQIYNYMDIGHSGWLGWPNNMSGAGPEYAKVVSASTGGYATVDGFVSDTANTTPADEPFLPNSTLSVGGQPLDSAKFYQYNPYFDEHHYDEAMYSEFTSSGFPSSIGMVIDTSRNGWGGSARPTALNSSPTTVDTYVAANKTDQRPFRGDWCNVNGAGIGARPQANPYGSGDHIIADVWIKPPGESDGDYPTASHTHGDPHCDPNGTQTDGNGGTYPTDAIPGYDVPAGNWFAFQFQQLVTNANPAM